MANKVYVGNLPYSFTSEDLEKLFSPHGPVRSAEVIMDRVTGRSRGFGFVEMDSPQSTQAAIQALHEKELEGRNLTVNEARERTPRGGSGGGGARAGWSGGGGGSGAGGGSGYSGAGGGGRAGFGGGGYSGGGRSGGGSRGNGSGWDRSDRGGRSGDGDRSGRGRRGGDGDYDG